MGMNNKNQPKERLNLPDVTLPARINWEVGITALGDIYIKFQSADQHFKCTMDAETAEKMGLALIDASEKKSTVVGETPIADDKDKEPIN